MKLKFCQNRGVISFYVLLLMSVFMTMGLALLGYQLGAFQDASNIRDGYQVKLLAETALQEADYYLRNINSGWTGASAEKTVAIGAKTIGTYKYSITQCGNVYDVTAGGYIPNSTSVKKVAHTISYKLRNPNPSILFTDGFELNNLAKWAGEVNDVGADWDINNSLPKNGTYHARGRRVSGGGTKIARLLSPIFNLSCYDEVILRFSYHRNGSATRIRVYQDNSGIGAAWTKIFEDSTNATASAYIRPAQRISITSLSSSVQFRFEAHCNGSSEAWYLDDVQLSTPISLYDPLVDG